MILNLVEIKLFDCIKLYSRFVNHITTCYGSIIFNFIWHVDFGDKCNESVVNFMDNLPYKKGS